MNPLHSLPLPIVAAPMAGGPSTPQLVRDVARAGGWGVLAGANKTPEIMASEIEQLRAEEISVGVNLFVPDQPVDESEAIEAVRRRLAPVAARFHTELGEPAWDDDDYAAKLAWLIAHPVDVVTFTFGLPGSDVIRRLHSVGTCVGITVTTVRDAQSAQAENPDFLIVQGPDAGGHQSLFTPSETPNSTPLLELVRGICAHDEIPVVASGGLATPADVRQVLDAGAVAAQVGTAFLRSSSAGSSPTHRAALASADFTTTTLTRAFSGRYARGLTNAFVAECAAGAPAAYPQINRLTAPLRKAAAAQGDPQWTHLWAGTGWQRTREKMPSELMDGEAGAIARWLASSR